MSDADILTALDGWLGVGQAPPVNNESFAVSTEPLQAASNDGTPAVTKPVTTVSAVRSTARTESTVSKLEDAVLSRTVSRGHFTQRPAPDTWTDDETTLCEARAQAFTAKGIAAQSADMLACHLMRRDRHDDDRRSCAECASFHAGHCRQRIIPIGETTIYTLHRCKGFELSEAIHD